MNPAYTCAKCGLAVIVVKGKDPIRPCDCNNTIVANMAGTVFSTSKMNQ